MVDDEFVAYLRELLAQVGRIETRRMFGGHGVYCDGLMMGLVAAGRLYLKTDSETRGEFEAAGCAPFVYLGQAKPITMSYYSVPDEALDAPDAMAPWGRRAMGAALRAAAGRSRKHRAASKRARER